MARLRLSKAEFLWREWRLGEGRFKGKGRKSTPRPTSIPYPIPMVWYARLLAFLARRKKVPVPSPSPPSPPPNPLGLFAKRMGMYRQPRGGNEGFEGAARIGNVGVALFNIGDHQPEEWDGHGARADANGIAWGYWKHCHSWQDIDYLLAESIRKDRRVVGINVESELISTLPPATILDSVRRSGYTGEWCTILLGWVQNGVDLSPIGDKPCYLEIFPSDAPALNPPREKTLHCLEHARAQNAKYPLPMYQTYREAQPSAYDLTLLHSLYTVDDIQEQWGFWTP